MHALPYGQLRRCSRPVSQLHPPGAWHHVVNVLVTALAKLAAQLVADLLIAAGPSTAALLIGHLLRAHAHAQYLLDLEARRRLSLWRTRRNDWQRRSSSSTLSCLRILALRGRAANAVLCSHAAIHSDPRSTRSPRRSPRRYTACARATTALPSGRALRFSFVARANNWDLGPVPTYQAPLRAPPISWIKRDSLLVARFTPKAVLCGYVPVQCLEHGERP